MSTFCQLLKNLSTLNKKRTDNQCVLFFVEMTGFLTSLEAFDLYCFNFCQFCQQINKAKNHINL
nr:MAG TPA: hypothetical protein [Caudoviricetes sp.]